MSKKKKAVDPNTRHNKKNRLKFYYSDPQEFAKKKKREKAYPKTAEEVGCGEGLAGEICRRNQKKVHKSKKKFIEDFKKSTYDFRNVKTSVDANEHAQAEKTATPALVKYLSKAVEADLQKIPFKKGNLTLYKKEDGLYSGHFQDRDGQVIHQFADVTIPILAKNLEVKEIYDVDTEGQPEPAMTLADESHEDEEEDRELIREIVSQAMDEHNEAYHQGQEPGEPIDDNKQNVRIKMGDLDIEIKKSINNFIRDFKKSKKYNKVDVVKAIQSWRRNSVNGKKHSSDLEAAKELLRDWDKYSEEFYQVMHALQAKDE